MFRLQQKKKEDAEKKKQEADKPGFQKQVSVRTRFLTREVAELELNLPDTCKVEFGDADDLRQFTLIVNPDEGYWKGGRFVFSIEVPEGYNISPPVAACHTRIWHPNITEDGKICLSILREHALDGTGWLPTRTLKDVVWGLNSLFTDLCDFDDPLNVDAAEQFRNDETITFVPLSSHFDQLMKVENEGFLVFIRKLEDEETHSIMHGNDTSQAQHLIKHKMSSRARRLDLYTNMHKASDKFYQSVLTNLLNSNSRKRNSTIS